eukprot:1225712-Amphidinium_carterae.1
MSAGRREAPPNSVARARFHQAALWFLALLGNGIFPLRRCIPPSYPHGTDDGLQRELRLDASPWGAGGVVAEAGIFVAKWQVRWITQESELLQLRIGESS